MDTSRTLTEWVLSNPNAILAGMGDSVTVRLFHGTDVESALWLLDYGVDAEKLLRYHDAFPSSAGSKAFCTTLDRSIAWDYATLNPAVYLKGLAPAIFSFDMQLVVMTQTLEGSPPSCRYVEEDSALEFFDLSAIQIVNSNMSNKTVTLEAEL